MYVSGFWFGVIATLAAEFILMVIHIAVLQLRASDEEEEEDDDHNNA